MERKWEREDEDGKKKKSYEALLASRGLKGLPGAKREEGFRGTK